jgi:site-specific recombinase XerD
MKIGDVHLEERYFHTRKGKTGEKIYPFREDLARFLKIYINNRKEQDVDTNILFLTKSLEPYGLRAFNEILEYARNKIGIEKRITTKTFRKTLNDYRKKMGCHKEDREMLLGHKPSSVNTRNYTPKPKDYGPADLRDHIQTYDRWYPYQDLNI